MWIDTSMIAPRCSTYTISGPQRPASTFEGIISLHYRAASTPSGVVVQEARLLAAGQQRAVGAAAAGPGHPPQQRHQLTPIAHSQ